MLSNIDLTKLSSYDYNLPQELIAQQAYQPADECKLLYWENGNIKDLIFKDILNLLDENDVLFFNNSKVVKARIRGGNQMKSFDEGNELKFYLVNKEGEKKECKNCEILFLRKIRDLGIDGDLGEKNIKSKENFKEVAGEKKMDLEIKIKKDNLQKSSQNLLISNYFEALVRPGKKFKIGRKILIEKNGKKYEFEILDFTKEGRIIQYLGNEDIFDVLEQIGKMPLPPYISYSKDKEKPYQPIQAKKAGSVAAPTASLHFTKKLLDDLKQKGIFFLESTLHIGMGTFKSVDTEDITKYDIHSELVEVPLDIFEKIGKIKEEGKKIIAVGTTATRILESLPYLYKRLQKIYLEDYHKIKSKYFDDLVENISLEDSEKFIDDNIIVSGNIISFDTKLYIYPGFEYKIINKLITNFHLPKSSLLMLVAAFMGYDEMMKAYKHAIENKYRFFSFGDAMFIDKG